MSRTICALALAWLAADTGRPGSRFVETFGNDPAGRWDIRRWGDKDGFHDAQEGIYFLTRDRNGTGVVMSAKSTLVSKRWKARFRFRITSAGTPADGFVFFFYKGPEVRTPPLGGDCAFGGSDGYGVFFDTYPNAGDTPPSVSLVRNTVSNHLAQVQDWRIVDGKWHQAEVRFDHGKIVVSLDGRKTFEHEEAPFDYTHSGFGFTAATGGCFSDQAIDDFVLEY